MKLNGIQIAAIFAVVMPPTELSWTGTFFGYRAVERNLVGPLAADRTVVSFEESLAGAFVALLYRPGQLRANHERWLHSLKKFVEDSSGR